MGSIKTGGPRFEVGRYDGRSDYLLWERQVKGVLSAIGLGRLLKPKPESAVEPALCEPESDAMLGALASVQVQHAARAVERHLRRAPQAGPHGAIVALVDMLEPAGCARYTSEMTDWECAH